MDVQIGAGKDTPIIIDDEDDTKPVVNETEDPLTLVKDTVEPIEIFEEPEQETSKQPPSCSPLIHEKSPTDEPKNGPSGAYEGWDDFL